MRVRHAVPAYYVAKPHCVSGRANPAVFGRYGEVDTPKNRRSYEITKRDPSQCATLFPVPAVRQ